MGVTALAEATEPLAVTHGPGLLAARGTWGEPTAERPLRNSRALPTPPASRRVCHGWCPVLIRVAASTDLVENQVLSLCSAPSGPVPPPGEP